MKEPHVRLIAVDLDGTLLRKNDDTEASPEDVQALREAQQAGLVVCIATGRPHSSAAMLLKRMGLGPVPIISFNGAMVWLPEEDEPILHLTVPSDVAREIMERGVEEDWNFYYFADGELYVPRMSWNAWEYWRRTGVRPRPVGDLRKLLDREPTKIILVDRPEKVDAAEPELMELWGQKAYVARSRPDIIEIVHPQANKGAALHELAEHLGIRPEQTMAIGDARNDLPLIQAAGLGVAMPDAAQEVKEAADVVIEPSNAPVAEAVRKLALGR